MKRIIPILLTLVTLLSLISCTQVDIDLRDGGNLYNNFAEYIGNQDAYEGKTIALTATHTAVYNFSENKIVRHSIMTWDKSGEKKALYEIRTSDGIYPTMGASTTVIGTFRDGGYIEVDRFSGTKMEKRSFDVEATDMTAAELERFITDYKKAYTKSEHYGDTIRIYGHCDSRDGYYYLLGLNGDGAYTWDVELYDAKGKITFPKAEDKTVNPVEIIGKLTTYVEDNITYACIQVESVAQVQSVFKTEEASK